MARVATEAMAGPVPAQGEGFMGDKKMISQPSAAAGAFESFFSKKSLLAVLCTTAFFVVVQNIDNGYAADFDSFATLEDEFVTLPDAILTRDVPNVDTKTQVPLALDVHVAEAEDHDATTIDEADKDADGAYTVRGFVYDIRCMSSMVLGMSLSALLTPKSISERARRREARVHEREERRQAREAAGGNADSDSEGSSSESESEDEGGHRLKCAKLYAYLM